MLVLVTQDQLVQRAVADTALVDHLERSGANIVEIFARLRGTEQREVAPHRPGGLERVVHRGEVLVQERALAVTVHEPQVLVRRDVREVPHQRAHQRGVDALEVGV